MLSFGGIIFRSKVFYGSGSRSISAATSSPRSHIECRQQWALNGKARRPQGLPVGRMVEQGGI